MNVIQLQCAWYFLVAGIILTAIGLLFPLKVLQRLDLKIFYFIHYKLLGKVQLFRILWPFGQTSFMVGVLGIFLLINGFSGLCAIFCFIIIACFERFIKQNMKRRRPFVLLPEIEIRQPQKPEDYSHPSGDTMRIWYLAGVIPFIFGFPLLILPVCLLIAVLISFGRIVFAVHFPLDVVGGMGLGIIGAAIFNIIVTSAPLVALL